MILVIYAAMAPVDCYCAWTDGFVYTLAETSVAGLGGLILGLERAVVSEFSLRAKAWTVLLRKLRQLQRFCERLAHMVSRGCGYIPLT